MLKMPEVAYVTTRPLAATAYTAPMTMPRIPYLRMSCIAGS
jgi:hypothetical protein